MELQTIKALLDMMVQADVMEFTYTDGEKTVTVSRRKDHDGVTDDDDFADALVIAESDKREGTSAASVGASGAGSAGAYPSDRLDKGDAEFAGQLARETTSTAATPPAAERQDGYQVLRAPTGGTVYLRDAPHARPLIEVGQQCKAGDKLCILEAMDVFRGISSGLDGEVTDIFCSDAQAVMPGQPLLRLRLRQMTD